MCMWWQRRPRQTNDMTGLNPPARSQRFTIG